MNEKYPSDKTVKEIPSRISIKHGLWKGKKVSFRSDRLIIKLKTPKNFQKEDEKNLKESVEKIVNKIKDAHILRTSKSRKGRFVLSVPTDCDILHTVNEIQKNNDVEYSKHIQGKTETLHAILYHP